MTGLLIRPAARSEAAELTALVRRSKAHWGYSPEFLAQAAPELTVHHDDVAESDPNAEPFYRAHGAVPIGRRISPTTGRDLTLLRLGVSTSSGRRARGQRALVSPPERN